MAIFFPIFTLLEDFGILPRIAFNMDSCFRKAGAHGKQALCMCMGIGCNAAGVTACRIIESRREKLIAILTNSFTPCNGRFPALIAMAAILASIVGISASLPFTIIFIFGAVLLSVGTTLFISALLAKTLLRGAQSGFLLELPPYRRPQFFKVVLTSMYEKTLKVLARAVCAAAPAGLVLWLLQTLTHNGLPLLHHITLMLDPFAKSFGLDGVILTAFILGMPANEIVIPIMLLCYTSGYSGGLTDGVSLSGTIDLLSQNGWSHITVICTTIFFLNHYPCLTTLITIKKETRSFFYTALAFILPTVTGLSLCFIISHLLNFL